MTAIEVRVLRAGKGGIEAVHGIELTVAPGEVRHAPVSQLAAARFDD
ncbi:hypothetical protein [Marmoricola sp. RAF53]